MNALKLGIVSCAGLGLAPWAPGTFGTLGGVALAWLLAGSQPFLLWVALLCVVIYAVGRSLADWAERRAGRKDPSFFVLDEVIGYLITVAWTGGPSYLTLVLAFFVFRFFDVWKPGWVRRAEAIPGADGVLLDDVVAGFFGLGVMALLRLFVGDPAMWEYGGAA